MKTTISIIAVLCLCFNTYAQDYVDLFRLSSNNTRLGNVDNDYMTNVYNQQLQIYLPIEVSDNFAILTGTTIENTNLTLFEGADRGNMWMTRLNLGAKINHGERWSGTYLVLPKIASDFQGLGRQDLQIGGLALMGYDISETWKIKFGLYVSSENHGSTVTPLLGVWHRSKNGKFFINAVLPIRADINYAFTKSFSVGGDLLTSVKAYNLGANGGGRYVQEESIRFGAYLAYSFLDGALLLRARAGYDTTEYGLFETGDRIGAQVLTFPVSGDNRNRLNPEYNGAFYFGGDLIYRFDLSDR